MTAQSYRRLVGAYAPELEGQACKTWTCLQRGLISRQSGGNKYGGFGAAKARRQLCRQPPLLYLLWHGSPILGWFCISKEDDGIGAVDSESWQRGRGGAVGRVSLRSWALKASAASELVI